MFEKDNFARKPGIYLSFFLEVLVSKITIKFVW